MSKEKKDIPFWLVWSPEGFHPKYKHISRESAVAEAMRLAGDHPSKQFYVLMPVGMAFKEDVRMEWFVETDDDLPF